jgi:hypothetical protein
MLMKCLVILGLGLLPLAAAADSTIELGKRWELTFEDVQKFEEEIGERTYEPILKVLEENMRLDRRAGLRFNVYELKGGTAEPSIRFYLQGPYVREKPGISLIIRF